MLTASNSFKNIQITSSHWKKLKKMLAEIDSFSTSKHVNFTCTKYFASRIFRIKYLANQPNHHNITQVITSICLSLAMGFTYFFANFWGYFQWTKMEYCTNSHTKKPASVFYKVFCIRYPANQPNHHNNTQVITSICLTPADGGFVYFAIDTRRTNWLMLERSEHSLSENLLLK